MSGDTAARRRAHDLLFSYHSSDCHFHYPLFDADKCNRLTAALVVHEAELADKEDAVIRADAALAAAVARAAFAEGIANELAKACGLPPAFREGGER